MPPHRQRCKGIKWRCDPSVCLSRALGAIRHVTRILHWGGGTEAARVKWHELTVLVFYCCYCGSTAAGVKLVGLIHSRCWQPKSCHLGQSSKVVFINRGATTAEKLRGTKVWVPTPGRLRPAPDQRPGWMLGAGGGRPLLLWGSGDVTPRKILENSDAKSCILVTLAVKFLTFLKLRPRNWGGDQYIT